MVAMVPETGIAKWLLDSTDGRQRREWSCLPDKAKVLLILLLHHHYHHYQPHKKTCASLQGPFQISPFISNILSGTQ